MEINILFRFSVWAILLTLQIVAVDGVAMKSSCSSRKTSVAECRTWCEKSERCVAYTYYADIHRCVPKNKSGWEKVFVKRVHSGLSHSKDVDEDTEYQGGDMEPPCPTREML